MRKGRKILSSELIEKIISLSSLPKGNVKSRFTKNQLIHLYLYISELNKLNTVLKGINENEEKRK